MKLIKSGILFGLLCSNMLVKSQNFIADMVIVKTQYEKLKYYKCNYEIDVYFNDKLNSTVKLEAMFSDSLYQYNIGTEVTTICNSNNVLTIDNEIKLLALGKRKSFNIDIEKQIPEIGDSSNYKIYGKIETNGWHTYTIIYYTGELSQSTVSINPATGYITYIDFTNREEEEYSWRTLGVRKTIIKFSDIKLIDPLPPSYFSLDKYLTKTKSGYQAANNFKSYQLLDTTIQPE